MKNKLKHTPGTWKVAGDEDFGFFVQADKLHKDDQCDIEILGEDHNQYPVEIYNADCRLIASAPEMIDALIEIYKNLLEIVNHNGSACPNFLCKKHDATYHCGDDEC